MASGDGVRTSSSCKVGAKDSSEAWRLSAVTVAAVLVEALWASVRVAEASASGSKRRWQADEETEGFKLMNKERSQTDE